MNTVYAVIITRRAVRCERKKRHEKVIIPNSTSLEVDEVWKLAHSTALRASFELALFGFVFPISPSVHFHIFTCYIRAYVDLGVLDIGFVLHKKVDL
jgi:hypothetical protein